jgi:uncharacterized protein
VDELQALLDSVPSTLEPLDVSMLDGFLCGLLLQPQRVPDPHWLPFITDVEGRALPARFDASRLHTLALRRYDELNQAIGSRQWFDPWVFELEDDDEDGAPAEARPRAGVGAFLDDDDEHEDDEGDDLAPPPIDAVYPWVAGFATAVDTFPGLMQMDAKELTEPLALVYRHLAPDDLEDADELLAEIESLEPPEDLTEAVEGLVRATLLLADISRPVSRPQGGGGGGKGRGRPAHRPGPHPARGNPRR